MFFLQAVCRLIFSDNASNAYSGLLSYPPQHARASFDQLLTECSTLTSGDVAKTQQTFNRFYELLEKSNKYV